MGFLDYGKARAATYVHNFDKDIDRLYQQEEYAARIRAEEQEKARFYAERLQKPETYTDYNSKRTTNFYNKKIDEVVNFINDNPNWENDIDGQMKFNELTNDIIDNDIIKEELQVQQELEKLKQARLKRDVSENKYTQMYDEYMAYANQDPENPEVSPFVYKDFQEIRYQDVIKNASSLLATETYEEVGKNNIKQIKSVSPESLNSRIEEIRDDEEQWEVVVNKFEKTKGNSGYNSPEEMLRINLETTKPTSELMKSLPSSMQRQDTEGGGSPIRTLNVIEQLLSKGETNTNKNNLYFAKGINGMNTTFNFSETNAKIINKDSGQAISFDESRPAIALSGGKIYYPENDDQPWTNVNVKVMYSAEEINSGIESAQGLIDAGFVKDRVSESGLIGESMKDINGLKDSDYVFTGMIRVPASFDQENIDQYEQATGGSGTKAQENYGLYKNVEKGFEAQNAERIISNKLKKDPKYKEYEWRIGQDRGIYRPVAYKDGEIVGYYKNGELFDK